jgi:hypothetical protein
MSSEVTQTVVLEPIDVFDADISKCQALSGIPVNTARWVAYYLSYACLCNFDMDANYFEDILTYRNKKKHPVEFFPDLTDVEMDEILTHVNRILDGPAFEFRLSGIPKHTILCKYEGKDDSEPESEEDEPVIKTMEELDENGKVKIHDPNNLPDWHQESTRKQHFNALSTRALDMSKMNISHTYKYLTQEMTPAAQKKFNEILEMTNADITSLCWALKLGNCSMMSKPMTPSEIASAAQLPAEDVVNPYEFMNTLADTISTRVLANKGYDFYMDPGTTDVQVVVCRIGAVIVHTKHNVAFGVEENHFLLKRFISLYDATNKHIVDLVRNKMALLPTEPASGVFMKYRPKRVVCQYVDYTGMKVKDYNRFQIEIKRHGAYPLPDFDLPPAVDLLALSMTTVGSSSLALYSVMTHTPSGSKILRNFADAAQSEVPLIKTGDILHFFSCYNTVSFGDLFECPEEMFGIEQMDLNFQSLLIESIIPIVAKDKGIYNNLRRVLQPFGSITLLLACVLRHLDSNFASLDWISYCSTDVANMLRLKVVATDSRSAPTRDGNVRPTPSSTASDSAPTRGRDQKALKINFVPPPVNNYHSSDEKKRTKPYCFIDLAFSGVLWEITDKAAYDKQQQQGNMKSAMDYFYHDALDSTYCSAPLFTVSKDKTIAANFDMFVVVMPISQLTTAYCRQLMSVYSVRMVVGSPSMNFSVYLVGKKSPKDASTAVLFQQWAAHLLVSRLKIYREAHEGFIEDVRAAVKSSHELLEKTKFIQECIATFKDDEFLGNFKRGTGSAANVNPFVNLLPKKVKYNKLTTSADY